MQGGDVAQRMPFANTEAGRCWGRGLRRGLKAKKTRKFCPHQGGTYIVIRTRLTVTAHTAPTVEECILLNPSQLVSGIIQACSSLISPDNIRTESGPAIWSVSLRGAEVAMCRKERYKPTGHTSSSNSQGTAKDALHVDAFLKLQQLLIWIPFSWYMFRMLPRCLLFLLYMCVYI